jgi:hypothetical protein
MGAVVVGALEAVVVEVGATVQQALLLAAVGVVLEAMGILLQ